MSEPKKLATPPGFQEWVDAWRAMPEVTCRCGETFRGVGAECFDCTQRSIRRGEAGPMIREFVPPLYRGRGFDQYECPPGDRQARDAVRAWGGRRGLYLYSQTKGSGKSHLAFALLQAKAGEARIAALEWSEYLEQRRASMRGVRDESLDLRLKALRTADLALIDDVGTGQVTDWAVAELWSVISARYQSARPTIVTANYALPQLAVRLAKADPEAADRIVSRLTEMCAALEVRANDYRTRRTA